MKLTEFFLIKIKKKTMITLDMQRLKMVVAVKVEGLVVLEDLMDQIFQIYLRISLGILEEEEKIIEEIQTEVQI